MFTLLLAVSMASGQGHSTRRPNPRMPIIQESGGPNRAFQRWERGFWQVLAGPDYCAADLQAGNMQFAIEQYWWTGAVRLQILSATWLSLGPRAGQRASLRISLGGGYAFASRDAIIAGNGEYGGFFMDFDGAEAANVPIRLAQASTIDIVADGRTLGAYDLAGVAEAMNQLESCVAIMRAADHRDPFAPGRR
jgi:hypothetical protein